MRIKLDGEMLSYMHTFSDVTGVTPRDCLFFDNSIVFTVPQGTIGQSIGDKGVKVKLLEKMFNKSVAVVEYADDPVKFLESVIYPAKLISGYVSSDNLNGQKLEAKIDGRVNYNRIKLIKLLMERYFNLKSVIIK